MAKKIEQKEKVETKVVFQREPKYKIGDIVGVYQDIPRQGIIIEADFNPSFDSWVYGVKLSVGSNSFTEMAIIKKF